MVGSPLSAPFSASDMALDYNGILQSSYKSFAFRTKNQAGEADAIKGQLSSAQLSV